MKKILLIPLVVVLVFGYFSYSSFQKEQRQKEAYALVNAYYTSQHAIFAEQGRFASTPEEAGFKPSGELNYKLKYEVADDGTSFIVTAYDDSGFAVRLDDKRKLQVFKNGLPAQ